MATRNKKLLIAAKALGYPTIRSLADAAGVDVDTISDLTLGRHTATQRTKARLARALRTSVEAVEMMLASEPTETRVSVEVASTLGASR